MMNYTLKSYDDMIKFLSEKTNVSVVRCEQAEADDMIATWIPTTSQKIIILLLVLTVISNVTSNRNVTQYNGTTDPSSYTRRI